MTGVMVTDSLTNGAAKLGDGYYGIKLNYNPVYKLNELYSYELLEQFNVRT